VCVGDRQLDTAASVDRRSTTSNTIIQAAEIVVGKRWTQERAKSWGPGRGPVDEGR
jgi:hypothetical protein